MVKMGVPDIGFGGDSNRTLEAWVLPWLQHSQRKMEELWNKEKHGRNEGSWGNR